MANARKLDKRRKSIRNIRKITRTMELIATARFKKAMDRASAATAYTRAVTKLVADLANAGLEVSHPLLEPRADVRRATMLVLSANRGLCGGFNGNVLRLAVGRRKELSASLNAEIRVEVSGKRGISGLKFRQIEVAESFTQFEDQPKYQQVDEIATRYLQQFVSGEMDRLDVVYTKFVSSSKQEAVVETLLPLGSLAADMPQTDKPTAGKDLYQFVPSAEGILEEVVPTSFKVKLFKCFLDSAVSEQIARMVAMKNATKSASDMIKSLSREYNRARQSQITGEIMEVLGGVEALKS
ncbi:MAG TPA: ATP synthase F1 subunit gamma [Pirellulaceae bacterium]|nr:ATP synthase F1 subunit gamma [Pirellulaceae bacterium]